MSGVSLQARGLAHRYGDRLVLHRLDLKSRRGSFSRSSAVAALAKPRCCDFWPDSRQPHKASCFRMACPYRV
jgi:hypothetical protein